jgi:hypothetical protein|tara:strand:+ start:1379 stop:1639 length:261 start_codon:yes stop_codon:yes gene_type:complete
MKVLSSSVPMRVLVVQMEAEVVAEAVVIVVMVQYHVDPTKYVMTQAAHVTHHQILSVSLLVSSLDVKIPEICSVILRLDGDHDLSK